MNMLPRFVNVFRRGAAVGAVIAAGAVTTLANAGGSPGCLGDVVPTGEVNVDDLLAIINRWGQAVVTHEVIVNATNTFIPSTTNAKSGDSVRWVRQGGSHTTTSGSNCMGNGTFSAPLTSASPQFTYVIPANFVGSIPYYCIPHCAFNMTGTINVGSFWEDIDGSGSVNVDDLLAVINNWGPCD